MLCPNCHSQTDNYCGSANITEETNKKYYCPDCGKEISKGSKYCSVCAPKHRENNLKKCPSLEQFIEDFKELKGFSQVGRKYDISDNAVKKWAKKFNLPYHTKELLEYINNHTLEEIISNKKVEENCINTEQTKFDHNLILKLIDLRYTVREISNYIGCSPDTVKVVGSKYKHSIRRANVKCIHCIDENNNVIKYCFGGTSTAHWLYNDINYKQYSIGTLEDMIIPAAKKCTKVNGILFKIQELPSIESIINSEENIKNLENLLYIE